MAAYLELCNVSFRYLEEAQADVLQHVNFALEEGKVTVLLGASGFFPLPVC